MSTKLTLEELLSETDYLLKENEALTTKENLTTEQTDDLIIPQTETKNKDNRKLRNAFYKFLGDLIIKSSRKELIFKPNYNNKIPIISGVWFLIKSLIGAIRFNSAQIALSKSKELKQQTIQKEIQIQRKIRLELEKIESSKETKTIKLKEEYLPFFYNELQLFNNLKVIQDEEDKLKFTIYTTLER